MSDKDMLISWLNDAHAMERLLLGVLENHVKDVKDHPAAERRIRKHIEETRQHAGRVEQCLKRLGTSFSNLKSGMATLMGPFQGMSTGLFEDEIVKNCLVDYAAEQFEVACYKALVEAAEAYGDREIARLCRENLREDEDMARFLGDQIPAVVRDALQVRPAGAH